MTQKTLYSLWGGLFIICAGLGFIPEPQGAAGTVFTCLSVAFFLPPAILLWQANKSGNHAAVKLIRNLSLASLSLTLVLLVMNVVSAMGPEFLGNVLHGLLIILSCPMVCSGYWALSLFLWACLLMASFLNLRKQ